MIKFSEDECNVIGSYGRFSKLNTPITPRENIIRTIKRANPLWIPMKSDMRIFCPQIYPDNVARAFVVEGKPYNGPVGGLDVFGVNWEFIPTAGGSMVKPGNPFLNDISEWKEKLKFPNLDEWDWEKSAQENTEFLDTDLFITSWFMNGMFERLISFIDFEDAAVALIDEEQQDYVKELFQALTDFYKKLIDKFVEYYHIDSIFFHDDWGSQREAFFSLDTCMEMIVPYIKQIVDHCHEKGIFFDFHCCGKNEKLVPAMLACGIDLWGGQPLNDKEMLVEKYGDKLVIGVSDPFVQANGSPLESKEELDKMAEEFMEKYAKDVPEKMVFLMNIVPNDAVIQAFYKAGRKWMSKDQNA